VEAEECKQLFMGRFLFSLIMRFQATALFPSVLKILLEIGMELKRELAVPSWWMP
jgi:hypothetical protein